MKAAWTVPAEYVMHFGHRICEDLGVDPDLDLDTHRLVAVPHGLTDDVLRAALAMALGNCRLQIDAVTAPWAALDAIPGGWEAVAAYVEGKP